MNLSELIAVIIIFIAVWYKSITYIVYSVKSIENKEYKNQYLDQIWVPLNKTFKGTISKIVKVYPEGRRVEM